MNKIIVYFFVFDHFILMLFEYFLQSISDFHVKLFKLPNTNARTGARIFFNIFDLNFFIVDSIVDLNIVIYRKYL